MYDFIIVGAGSAGVYLLIDCLQIRLLRFALLKLDRKIPV